MKIVPNEALNSISDDAIKKMVELGIIERPHKPKPPPGRLVTDGNHSIALLLASLALAVSVLSMAIVAFARSAT